MHVCQIKALFFQQKVSHWPYQAADADDTPLYTFFSIVFKPALYDKASGRSEEEMRGNLHS